MPNPPQPAAGAGQHDAVVQPPRRRGKPPPRADPRAGRRRGTRRHRRRRRGLAQHASTRRPARRSPRRPVPARAQQGAALRPGRRRGAGRGRHPGRPALSAGPNGSRSSPAGCARPWKTIPASPPCSRHATPSGPHSLALAEAFLTPLQDAGLPARATAQAFSLVYDYTLGFALSDRTTVNEQRVQDPATRRQLHAFFRSLPADRFPALAALGQHVWAGNRDQRFTAGLDTLLAGLQAASARPRGRPAGR